MLQIIYIYEIVKNFNSTFESSDHNSNYQYQMRLKFIYLSHDCIVYFDLDIGAH